MSDLDFLDSDRGAITSDPPMPFEAYGVKLSTIGDEGDWIALGHVEPLRMLAAMRKIGRKKFGINDEEVFGDYRGYQLVDNVKHTKAVFTVPSDGYDWWGHWSREAIDSEYSIPVTMWRV